MSRKGVMTVKVFYSTTAIVLTIVAFFPYIRSILQGKIKPHVFSWVIWGLTTCVIFLAQVQDKGGVGAWPIGVSGCITLYIALLAYSKRTDISIARTDWFFLLSAMTSLPFWYFTKDPLWAVIILTIVDVAGFGPTIRKAYHFPFEEQVTFFALFMTRNLLVILALEHYSLTTVLFPAVIAIVCIVLMIVIVLRRRALENLGME
jgi:hypothetical protein